DAGPWGPRRPAAPAPRGAAPRPAEVPERGAAQPLAEQGEAQLGAALEHGAPAGRPGLERVRVARLVEPTRIAGAVVDRCGGTPRPAQGVGQCQEAPRVYRHHFGPQPVLRVPPHAGRPPGEETPLGMQPQAGAGLVDGTGPGRPEPRREHHVVGDPPVAAPPRPAPAIIQTPTRY